MIRLVCAISVLAFAACAAPTRYIPSKRGPVQLAIVTSDTAAVRQLCMAPDSVVTGSKPCILRGR